jgi:hypothetical protein
MTMILRNKNNIIKIKLFLQNAHLKIFITGMQIGKNGRINCKLPQT